jgi:cyclase
MPLGYGGGIQTIADVRKILSIGIEKVIFNSAIHNNPDLIKEASREVGSQSVVVSLDYKYNLFGRPKIYSHAGLKTQPQSIVDFALYAESIGAGELILNSVDRDGTMKGYDIQLIKEVSSKVSIPVVACGGAGTLEHLKEAIQEGKASAVAAGSIFVFHGSLNGVLINYPSQEKLKVIFN